MAEKNRLAQAAKNAQAANEMMGMGAAAEPTKLMVSELHPHIAEADVREVFAPFGELAEVALMKDPATQASLGVANITYIDPAHAKDAQQAINGLELAGKQLVVQLVQEAPPVAAPMMGGGMGLAPLGGMAGMAGMMGMGGMMGMDAGPVAAPSLCVLMKNMFDPNGDDEKNDPEFFNDLQEDVQEECGKYGAVVSAKVKPTTAGTGASSDASSWQRQSLPAAHGRGALALCARRPVGCACPLGSRAERWPLGPRSASVAPLRPERSVILWARWLGEQGCPLGPRGGEVSPRGCRREAAAAVRCQPTDSTAFWTPSRLHLHEVCRPAGRDRLRGRHDWPLVRWEADQRGLRDRGRVRVCVEGKPPAPPAPPHARANPPPRAPREYRHPSAEGAHAAGRRT